MSQFNPKKLNIEAIHAGQRYPDTRSAFLPSDVNEIIESLYGISLGVENSAKRAFIMSTPGNLIDISAVNKNIYFPKGTTIYADGYSDNFVEDKYVEFDRSVQLLKRGQVLYNKMDKSLSIIPYGFNSGSTYQFLYLFSFAYDSENNLVTDLPVEHLVNGEKQSSDRTIVKEPYNSGFAYINIDTKSYEIAIPEGTGFGDIAFNWDETYSYAEIVENEEGYLYDIAIVYDRTEKLIKSIYLYELYEYRNYAWLFTIRMDGDKFVYCDLEAPFYVDGVLFDGGSSVEIVQETGDNETAVMSQAAATRSFVNINEDGSASVGAPTSGESAINAYALKRHLSRHSTLYPSKEENGVTVFNKLKFVMPTDDSYFAMVGDHSAETGGINPKVSFDTTHAVYIPSVVPTSQYEGYGYSPVPVDLPVNSIRIGAFQQNRTVRSVVIQEGVARIEANAFNGCKQLTSIVLADTIKMIDNNAFNNVGTEVSSAKIPVKLPKALEYICQQAFNQVNVCGSIVFPNRCLYIGGIPNNLTSGAGKVFTSPKITQIVFEGTPKYIHSHSFSGCICDIYVPWGEGKVDGAPWGTTGTVHYNSYPNAFPNIDIVQTTGESTTAVMSQKASTESFVPQLPPKLSTTSVYVTTAEGNPSVVPIFYAGLNPNSGVCGKLANGRIDVRTVEGEYDATNKKYVDEGFVPKLQIAEGTGTFAYVADSTNAVGKIQIQYGAPIAYTLPARDAGGIVIVGTPFGDKHAVNLGYANAHYVQVTPNNSGIMQAFVQNTDGTTAMVGVNTYAADYSIARRYTDGRLKVAPPVLAEDATPKSYVDTKTEWKEGYVAGAKELIVDISLDFSMNNGSASPIGHAYNVYVPMFGREETKVLVTIKDENGNLHTEYIDIYSGETSLWWGYSTGRFGLIDAGDGSGDLILTVIASK